MVELVNHVSGQHLQIVPDTCEYQIALKNWIQANLQASLKANLGRRCKNLPGSPYPSAQIKLLLIAVSAKNSALIISLSKPTKWF